MDLALVKQARELVTQARAILEEIKGDMDDAYDAETDEWKVSDTGELFATKVASLEEAIDSLNNCDNSLDETIGA